MAFQRARLAADRTLIAIMRTSLALIGFGFTVFQLLARLDELTSAKRAILVALMVLGFTGQVLAVWKYVDFRRELHDSAAELVKEQLMPARTRPAHSLTLGLAFVLVFVGLAATVGVAIQALLH